MHVKIGLGDDHPLIWPERYQDRQGESSFSRLDAAGLEFDPARKKLEQAEPAEARAAAAEILCQRVYPDAPPSRGL